MKNVKAAGYTVAIEVHMMPKMALTKHSYQKNDRTGQPDEHHKTMTMAIMAKTH